MESDGAVVRGRLLSYRLPPEDGFCRKAVAALLGLHPRSVKRLDVVGSELRAGRCAENQRVLRYSVRAVVADIVTNRRFVDVGAAIELGFPISMVPSALLATSSGSGGTACRRRERLIPLPANEAQVLNRAYLAWRSVHQTADPRVDSTPAPIPSPLPVVIDRQLLIGLAALTDATLSKVNLARWADRTGHSTGHIACQVAAVARALRHQLGTPLGQSLCAALLGNSYPIPTSSPDAVIDHAGKKPKFPDEEITLSVLTPSFGARKND